MPAGVRANATLEGQGSATRMHNGHSGSVRRTDRVFAALRSSEPERTMCLGRLKM